METGNIAQSFNMVSWRVGLRLVYLVSDRMRDDEKVADKSLPSNISAHCHKEMLSTYK
jgi:hypothetical protein